MPAGPQTEHPGSDRPHAVIYFWCITDKVFPEGEVGFGLFGIVEHCNFLFMLLLFRVLRTKAEFKNC